MECGGCGEIVNPGTECYFRDLDDPLVVYCQQCGEGENAKFKTPAR